MWLQWIPAKWNLQLLQLTRPTTCAQLASGEGEAQPSAWQRATTVLAFVMQPWIVQYIFGRWQFDLCAAPGHPANCSCHWRVSLLTWLNYISDSVAAVCVCVITIAGWFRLLAFGKWNLQPSPKMKSTISSQKLLNEIMTYLNINHNWSERLPASSVGNICHWINCQGPQRRSNLGFIQHVC